MEDEKPTYYAGPGLYLPSAWDPVADNLKQVIAHGVKNKWPPGPEDYWQLYPWERPKGVIPPDPPKMYPAMWPSWLFPKGPDIATHKQCAKCKGWGKRTFAFHKDSASPDGHRRICKMCSAKQTEAWRAKNLDDLKAREKAKRETPEFKAKRRAYLEANRQQTNEWARRYSARNPDMMPECWAKWANKNRDYLRERKQEWNEANPLAVKEQRFRRRVRLKNARAQRLTADLIAQRVSVFGDVCAYCGEPWSHLDHVIPLARGGMHCLANLRPACARCNHRKGAKSAKKWLQMVAEGKHK